MGIDLVNPPVTAADTAPRRAVALVASGLLRVGSVPAVLLGAWALTLLVALPSSWLVHRAIATDLGASLAAARAAEGVDWTWWQEFADRQPALAATFRPSIIGFAAVLQNAGDLLDGRLPAGPALAAVVTYVLAWSFLLGGALDRYARGRRTGAAGFFAACGVFFWRFVRLGVMALAAYAFLFLVLHPWLFVDLFGRVTRDLTSERVAAGWRVGLYAVFAALLAATTVVFDYARIRAVVEDRRSMLGSLAAGARFVRRHVATVAALYALNLLLLVMVWVGYALASPGATAPVWVTLAVGQAYLVARLALRLTAYAAGTLLFQDRLAHAAYTAAPPRRWPDSPAVEAIANAAPVPNERT